MDVVLMGLLKHKLKMAEDNCMEIALENHDLRATNSYLLERIKLLEEYKTLYFELKEAECRH